MSEAYKQAGVNIDAGNEVVKRIAAHVKRTERPEVLSELGSFGGFFALKKDLEEPILVSTTDGVGTKLKIAFALDQHDTIGIDCVAMCVNDLVVQGAEPLFFLDYLATGRLEPAKAEEIIKGIADGCQQAGCALIGGETAEMPGMYQEGEYDLAGFAVGVVEKKRLIDGRSIQAGDRVIGLASHGLHSNGFSLVRKVLLDGRTYDWSERVPSSEQTLAEALLQPTRIYVKTFLSIMEAFTIKGAAHITGGGLIENVPRVLPKGLKAVIDPTRWPVPAIFRWIQTEGILTQWDMYRTFNMGIGMVLIVSEEESENVLAYAQELGEKAYLIGIIEEGQEGVVLEKESVS